MMQNYSIALVMIVKNEARAIERCLKSVASFVDSMIVLDTGSTDATIELAQQCGATVYRFTWSDDFAAARNAALDYSTADWNLILDADEWLIKGAEALKTLRATPPNFVGSVEVCSSYDVNSTQHSASSIISRLLPRGVRYQGIIHEQPEHNLSVKKTGIKLGHDGYEPQQREAKELRNIMLLERALKADPDDYYLQYKLGVEYDLNSQSELAQLHYETAIKSCPANISWRLDLVIRLLFIYQQSALFDRAFTLAEQEQGLSSLSADYYFALGNLYLDYAIAHPKQAAEIIPKIEQCWLNCLKQGEALGVNGAVAGRGSFLAAHNLAIFYQSLGDSTKYRYYLQLSRQTKIVKNFKKTPKV